MDKYAKLIGNLKAIGGNNNIPLITAVVKSVEGNSCTITYGDADNAADLSDVRLKADIETQNSEFILITPAVGSLVICGSISGNFEDLCVLKADKISSIEIKKNGLHVLIDGNDGKISISNNRANLLDLFNQLVSILNQLKVYTPSGVSGTIIPDSQLRVNDFEMSFKNLLK